MLVSEAAKKLDMNTQTLRLALQQRLFPFGVAVKTSENRFTYYVNPTRLEKYLDGTDCEKANNAFVGEFNPNGVWKDARTINH